MSRKKYIHKLRKKLKRQNQMLRSLYASRYYPGVCYDEDELLEEISRVELSIEKLEDELESVQELEGF